MARVGAGDGGTRVLTNDPTIHVLSTGGVERPHDPCQRPDPASGSTVMEIHALEFVHRVTTQIPDRRRHQTASRAVRRRVLVADPRGAAGAAGGGGGRRAHA